MLQSEDLLKAAMAAMTKDKAKFSKLWENRYLLAYKLFLNQYFLLFKLFNLILI